MDQLRKTFANKSIAAVVWLAAIICGCVVEGAGAEVGQETARAKSVWDGVYTDAQSARGKVSYGVACAQCHAQSLQGFSAPPLAGDRFLDRWREDTLEGLFTFVKTRMPPDLTRLPEENYLDILAYMLQSNGMRPGSDQLTAETVKDIQLIGQGGPQPVPNGALVWLVGCLTQRADTEWALTHATEPARSRNGDEATAEELELAVAKPLGGQAFALHNLNFARTAPDLSLVSSKEHKLLVKGNVFRGSSDDHINVTWVGVAAEGCLP